MCCYTFVIIKQWLDIYVAESGSALYRPAFPTPVQTPPVASLSKMRKNTRISVNVKTVFKVGHLCLYLQVLQNYWKNTKIQRAIHTKTVGVVEAKKRVAFIVSQSYA